MAKCRRLLLKKNFIILYQRQRFVSRPDFGRHGFHRQYRRHFQALVTTLSDIMSPILMAGGHAHVAPQWRRILAARSAPLPMDIGKRGRVRAMRLSGEPLAVESARRGMLLHARAGFRCQLQVADFDVDLVSFVTASRRHAKIITDYISPMYFFLRHRALSVARRSSPPQARWT